MDGEDHLLVELVGRGEDLSVVAFETRRREVQRFNGLLGHSEVRRTAAGDAVHPQRIVGLEHLHRGGRGYGLVRIVGHVPLGFGQVAFDPGEDLGLRRAGQVEVAGRGFVPRKGQRSVAPDACDPEIAPRAGEIGVAQTEIADRFRNSHLRHVLENQVGLIDGLIHDAPVGIGVARRHGAGAHLRLVHARQRFVRARAPETVAKFTPAEVDVVYALERVAHVEVDAVGRRLGVAFVDPHVAGRELVVLHDIEVAVAAAHRARRSQQGSQYLFAFHGLVVLRG